MTKQKTKKAIGKLREMQSRIRALEAQLVRTDQAMAEGLKLSDLSDGILVTELRRRDWVSFHVGPLAGRQMTIEQDGPIQYGFDNAELRRRELEQDRRAVEMGLVDAATYDVWAGNTPAGADIGPTAYRGPMLPSVGDVFGVDAAAYAPMHDALAAQELADSINAAPATRARAMVSGSTITLRGVDLAHGDVVTINDQTFRLGQAPSPPRPRRYVPPVKRLDGRRAR